MNRERVEGAAQSSHHYHPVPPKENLMADIEDPWNSRPIDVHRWSDHPEVAALADTVWDEYVAIVQRSGPKPKTAFRHQLRVLLLDLYVAWLRDRTLCIGVSLSSNYWDTSSRYNAIHISKKIIPIIKTLHENGLLDLAKGSYSGPGVPGNRTTRIRASERLQAMFAEAKFERDDVTRIPNEEVILLRSEDDGLVDYEDTDETNEMREQVRRYNDVIAGSFIDIPVLDEPVIDDQPTDHHHCRTRRIFSRSEWTKNGRFHSGWWQQVNSDWRSKIFINDTPTVEVDFRGLHVAILSAEQGVELEGDPYDLPDRIIKAGPPELQRSLVKRLLLTAINASSRDAAYRAFRDGFPKDSLGKMLTNEQLDSLVAAFIKKSPHLEESLFSDQGIRLMNVDSQITALIHHEFTSQAIPVLSVHDSYIVDYTRVAHLKEVMANASEVVVGKALAATSEAYGLDEMTGAENFMVQEYIMSRQTARSEGYMKRLAKHEKRTGTVVLPFDR